MLGALGVLNVLNVLYVLNVLNMLMDASLACWAMLLVLLFGFIRQGFGSKPLLSDFSFFY